MERAMDGVSPRLAMPIEMTGSSARRARAEAHGLHVTQLAPDPEQPSPRYQHTATVLGSGSNRFVVVFGGRERAGALSPNAIHLYDVSRAAWHKPSPAGFAPSARFGHVAAAVGFNRMMVAGGVGEEGLLRDAALLTLARNDVWEPDEGVWRAGSAQLHWTRLFTPKGVQPPPGRAYAAAAACDGKVWVHGGSLVPTVTCQRVAPSSPRSPRSPRSPFMPAPPSPRGGAGRVRVASHRVRSLLDFSRYPQGWAAEGLTDALLVAELADSLVVWRELPASALSGAVPCARAHHTMAALPHGRLLLLGGHGSGEVDARALERVQSDDRTRHSLKGIPTLGPDRLSSNACGRHLADTRVLDTRTLTWASLVCAGLRPAPRHSAALAVQEGARSIYLLGGQVAAPNAAAAGGVSNGTAVPFPTHRGSLDVAQLPAVCHRGSCDVAQLPAVTSVTSPPRTRPADSAAAGAAGAARGARSVGPREAVAGAELHVLGTELGAWWSPAQAAAGRRRGNDARGERSGGTQRAARRSAGVAAGGGGGVGGGDGGGEEAAARFTAGSAACIGSGKLLLFGGSLAPIPLPPHDGGADAHRSAAGNGGGTGGSAGAHGAHGRALRLGDGVVSGDASLLELSTRRVLRVSPRAGLIVGGTTVSIEGERFDEGGAPLLVRFAAILHAGTDAERCVELCVPAVVRAAGLASAVAPSFVAHLPEGLVTVEVATLPAALLGTGGLESVRVRAEREAPGRTGDGGARARAASAPRRARIRAAGVDAAEGGAPLDGRAGDGARGASPRARAPSPPASPRARRAQRERAARLALLALVERRRGGADPLDLAELPSTVRSLLEWTADGVEFCYVGATDPMRCAYSGEGLTRAVAGERARIDVVAHDLLGRRRLHGGDAFSLVSAPVDRGALHAPDGGMTAADRADGSYELGYTPTRAGDLELVVQLNGLPCRTVRARVSAGAADAGACRIDGLAQVAQHSAGEPIRFELLAFDRFRNPTSASAADFDVSLAPLGGARQRVRRVSASSASSVETADAADEADMGGAVDVRVSDTCHVTLVVERAGRYRLDCRLRGLPIGDARAGPRVLDVVAARAVGERSVVQGPGTRGGLSGPPLSFEVHTYDAFGNPRMRGGDDVRAALRWRDGGDGAGRPPPPTVSIVEQSVGGYRCTYETTLAQSAKHGAAKGRELREVVPLHGELLLDVSVNGWALPTCAVLLRGAPDGAAGAAGDAAGAAGDVAGGGVA
ncbi:hypothetical protein KFE25_004093 [Diacronema lutheri]|uniref:IPT/TIG domain-containing protein n=1 Tax=Diacronema lutheri TaxID=2081491 RepID=A0A8J6CBL5_DIALT|nr:hypothetical protein KFE25_004093 [Diacronema lutheri]